MDESRRQEARDRAIASDIARWRSRHQDTVTSETAITLSQLVVQHVQQKANTFYERHHAAKVPSLTSMAVGAIISVLQTSRDPDSDASMIAQNVSSNALCGLLRDPRLPYRFLRLFCNLPQTRLSKHPAGAERGLIDIDEAILQTDRYLRSRSDASEATADIIHLDELPSLIPGCKLDGESLTFVRKDPPKGGLEILDTLRSRNVRILATDLGFSQTFGRTSGHALRGLNWNNVILAGGMALMTLLTRVDSVPNFEPVIQLYIFGLGCEAANRKVEHIYDTWLGNLPDGTTNPRVTKNTRRIELYTDDVHFCLQIVLQLYNSPANVLRQFDLDFCAVGYDGHRVVMLPRCARAIETGYSTFTMQLAQGGFTSDRHAAQNFAVLRYAERGFGVRFLPSCARLLEEAAVAYTSQQKDHCNTTSRHWDLADVPWDEIDRYPCGKEPGLKTMKRIAYLGRDFTQRFFFGRSPLLISPYQYQHKVNPHLKVDDNLQQEWTYRLRKAEEDAQRRTGEDGNPGLGLFTVHSLYHFFSDSPDFFKSREGLGAFEMFMRYCEAWRLNTSNDGPPDPRRLPDERYTPNRTYSYVFAQWNEEKDWQNNLLRENQLQRMNSDLWHMTKIVISSKLATDVRQHSFRNFSTRMARKQVSGPNLAAVLQKQLTIPIVVPPELEDFILFQVQRTYPGLPQAPFQFPWLIPAHDPSTYDASVTQLPSLIDTNSASGNLRYWIVTNESMWAGQHPVLDAITEAMEALHSWIIHQTSHQRDSIDTDSMECWCHVARYLNTPITLPEMLKNSEAEEKLDSFGEEARRFQSWALALPFKRLGVEDGYLTYPEQYAKEEEDAHELFTEWQYLYPFPDDLFWRDGDEGERKQEGTLQWSDPV